MPLHPTFTPIFIVLPGNPQIELNMKLTFAFAFAFASASAFFLTACDKDPISPVDPLRIDLQAPVIGQENHYLKYSGICGQLLPTGDTLVLRVKDFNGTDIVF